MPSIERLIIYFAAGIVSTLLETLNVRFITKGKALQASLITFSVVLIGFGVLFDIIANLNQSGFLGIVIYAIGVGIGTFIGTNLRLK